jgi:hypothetical protein
VLHADVRVFIDSGLEKQKYRIRSARRKGQRARFRAPLRTGRSRVGARGSLHAAASSSMSKSISKRDTRACTLLAFTVHAETGRGGDCVTIIQRGKIMFTDALRCPRIKRSYVRDKTRMICRYTVSINGNYKRL